MGSLSPLVRYSDERAGRIEPARWIVVRDLSWQGHDFAAAIQNESVWATIKQKLSPNELATMPLTIIKDVGVALLKAYAMRKLGLSDS